MLLFSISSLLICVARIYAPHITILTLVFFCFIHSSLTYDTPFKLNIMASLLSATLCHFLFFISTFCISTIIVVATINKNVPDKLHLSAMPLVGLIQIFL